MIAIFKNIRTLRQFRTLKTDEKTVTIDWTRQLRLRRSRYTISTITPLNL